MGLSGQSLYSLRPGQRGRVVSVGGRGVVKQRLLDMGLTPGAEVALCKRAPFGDPMEIRLRGYALILREEEARRILIERM